MTLTDKQIKYAQHRAAGHRPTQAARFAGYAAGSAKVSASRLERNAAVRKVIAAGAAAAPERTAAYATAEEYLVAVVSGAELPDPLRVSAARALIQYQAPRQRHPIPAARTPRQAAADADVIGQAAEDADWDRRSAEIERRFHR